MRILKEDITISREIYKFLNDNIQLINECKFDELFKKANNVFISYDFVIIYNLIYKKFPDCVNYMTFIPSYFFYDNADIKSFTIPNNVKKIEQVAFKECKSLTNIEIPNSVLDIGEGAFEYCESLTNITIPNSLIKIKNVLFWCCNSLINLEIPKSVTSIGDQPFGNCDKLTSIKYLGTKQDWKNIEKSSEWHKYSRIKEVQCTDGILKYRV